MAYTIEYASEIRKEISRLPKNIQHRVDKTILALAETPRPAGCIKLAGQTDLYRVRVGDYRIVYGIYDGRKIVIILIVAHRRDVYRGL
jgi:mRNA interferase RelE/StbE